MIKNIKLIGFWDLIIILSLILIMVICLIVSKDNFSEKTAVITQNGVEIYRINLRDVKEAYDINLNDEYNVIIKVEPDGISFKYSDCPDKLCIKSGKIVKENQVAICLPAKVSVKIVGNNKHIDAVTG